MPSPSTDAERRPAPAVPVWRPAGPQRENRLGRIVIVSVVVHLALAWFLTQVEFGRQLVQKVVSVRLVERKRPPKPPPPKPKPVKARPKAPPKVAPQQRPQTALAPGAAGTAGVGIADDGGQTGTVEVPVGAGLDLPATPSAPPPLVVEVGDSDGVAAISRQPEAIGGLRIAYPEVARIGGVQGDAEVQAYVDASGFVRSAALRRASTPLFGRAAVEAVRQSRFLPALRLGVPVAATIRVPVRFTLNAARVLEATASLIVEGDDTEAPEPEVGATPSAQVATPSAGAESMGQVGAPAGASVADYGRPEASASGTVPVSLEASASMEVTP
ncbi:MAG: TonB family protein [Candidatus Sericytochromatia bacterium]|nr:TonB family protein [Candidatus Sericytochromatia bacterium]